jgi:hypothetical protein
MRKPKRPDPASLDEIIDELTAEAGTDDGGSGTSDRHCRNTFGCLATGL